MFWECMRMFSSRQTCCSTATPASNINTNHRNSCVPRHSVIMKCYHASLLSLSCHFPLCNHVFLTRWDGPRVFINGVVLLFVHRRLTCSPPSPYNDQRKQQHNNNFESNTNKEDETVNAWWVHCQQHLSWVVLSQAVPGLAEVESGVVRLHRGKRQHLSWAHLEQQGAGRICPLVPGVAVSCWVSCTAARQIHTAAQWHQSRMTHLNRNIQRRTCVKNTTPVQLIYSHL